MFFLIIKTKYMLVVILLLLVICFSICTVNIYEIKQNSTRIEHINAIITEVEQDLKQQKNTFKRSFIRTKYNVGDVAVYMGTTFTVSDIEMDLHNQCILYLLTKSWNGQYSNQPAGFWVNENQL